MLACGGLLAWWEPMAWSGVGSGWAMLQWPEMCHRIREEVGRSPQPLSLLLLDLLFMPLAKGLNTLKKHIGFHPEFNLGVETGDALHIPKVYKEVELT